MNWLGLLVCLGACAVALVWRPAWHVGTEANFDMVDIGQMAIHVYDIPPEMLWPFEDEPTRDMYYAEILLPRLFKNSSVYTADASRAHLFVVPHFSTQYYHRCVFTERIYSADECKWRTGDYFERILSHIRIAFPYWDRSAGSDHVIAFSWDQASEVLGILSPSGEYRDHPARQMARAAIQLTTQGTLVTKFNFDPQKDIVVPPFLDALRYTRARSEIPLDTPRKYFAHFRGTIFDDYAYSRGVRQSLKRMSASEPHLVVREGHSADYLVELAQATFALCPSGWSDWSPRVFEAMAMGAVPVIYADGIRLPFEDAIDYSEICVKIANGHVGETMDRLRQIGDAKVKEMRERLEASARAFFYHEPPESGDAFDFILRALNRKRATYPPVAFREF